ncbi:hypothetical protein AB0D34_14845 [Streptomyces sp. NPDC048420]|uniref:hypothetical protein n=1 Tax=Streptomyces sp. NPDC048420 TaxID=3155755 RepID=UPI00343A254B
MRKPSDVVDAGPGELGALKGKPAVLTLSRGGGYGPGTPKEGWGHATPYLSLRGPAEESMKTGHEQAAEHGPSRGSPRAARHRTDLRDGHRARFRDT